MIVRLGLLLLSIAALHVKAGQSATVTLSFSLAEPAKQLTVSPYHSEIAQYATSTDGNIRWQQSNGQVQLVSDKPFDQITLRLSSDIDNPSGYAPLHFTDSGAILYMPYWQTLFKTKDYQLSLPSDTNVYIDGEPVTKIVEPCDCFALLSREKPITQNDASKLHIDSRFNSVEHKRISGFIAASLKHFNRQFGALPQATMLVVKYLDEQAPYSRGDVIAGTAYLQIKAQQLQQHPEQIESLIAHEVFHLWHERLFVDDAPKWIYEGAANAMAHSVSSGKKDELMTEALNLCANLINNSNLSAQVFDDGIYHCGHMLFASFEDSGLAHLSGSKLWQSPLSVESLLSLVKKIEDKTYRQALLAFIQGRFDVTLFPRLFPNTRLSRRNAEQATEQESKVACASSFAKVMNHDCAGVSFSLTDNGLKVVDAPQCGNIKDGVIVKFNGLEYPNQCFNVKGSIYARCQSKANPLMGIHPQVTLEYADGTQVLAACPDALEPPAVLFQF